MFILKVMKDNNNITSDKMLHTKEFYEIMNAFEDYAKKELRVGHQGFSRESKDSWKKRVYYTDGRANDAFKVFLAGYSFSKSYNI